MVVAIAEALRIDTGGEASLRQTSLISRMRANATTAKECHDPSQESLAALVECNCLSDLVSKCGDVTDVDPVRCLLNHACTNDKVCAPWREEKCDASAYVGGGDSAMLQGSDLQKFKPRPSIRRAATNSLATVNEQAHMQTHEILGLEDALHVRKLQLTAASEQEISEARRLDSTLQSKCA
jgi:hypothetical protein